MHILLAEDQQEERLVLATQLRNWGHHVIEASNGAEALDYINSNIYNLDMLITDWGMPLMDGVELARRARAITATSQYIYIILLTRRAELNDMIQGFMQGGVDDYINKPFEMMELQTRIHVGNRVVQAERSQRLYSQSLERIVNRQSEAIRETQAEIISRLFNVLAHKEQETEEHLIRVGKVSAFLGTAMGWGISHVEAIRAAASLHDIGKIAISDNILSKTTPLPMEDFELVRQHAIIGGDMLSGSKNSVIQMGELIARYHHENWDGTGYPAKLHGPAIPTEARIVAIADVYDTLCSKRTYRKAFPEEDALQIIQNEAGKKFDPDICVLFIKNIDTIRKIYKE